MNNLYIYQTAKDYDLEFWEVSLIYKLHPNDFHEALEKYLRTKYKLIKT